MKICIIGAPKTGKSTLAYSYNVPVFCTDKASTVREVLANVTYLPEEIEFKNTSRFICDNWFTMNGTWVIEGVALVNALRKWVEYYNTIPPCYNIVYIKNNHPKAGEILDGHKAMAKSVDTVWNQIINYYGGITEYKY